MITKQVALGVFLGCIVVAMGAGMVAILLPSGSVDESVMITIMIVGFYALGGLIIVGIGGKMRRTFRLCVSGLAASMVIYLIAVWFERSLGWRWEQFVWRSGTIALIVGIGFAHRLLVCPLRAPNLAGVISKRSALISGAVLSGALIIGLVNDGFGSWDELVVRIIGVTALVAAGSTVAAGALAIFGPKPGDDEPGLLADSMPVSMTCPRCQSPVEVRSNKEARCQSCRLKIRIEVEEPRCTCGYLLYELKSDVCPECGKAIDPQDRWKRASLV